jgi:hypothetical protein
MAAKPAAPVKKAAGSKKTVKAFLGGKPTVPIIAS